MKSQALFWYTHIEGNLHGQISVKKDNDEKVLCPHCGAEIIEVIEKTVKTGALNITNKSIYACGKCHKVIPVIHTTYAF